MKRKSGPGTGRNSVNGLFGSKKRENAKTTEDPKVALETFLAKDIYAGPLKRQFPTLTPDQIVKHLLAQKATLDGRKVRGEELQGADKSMYDALEPMIISAKRLGELQSTLNSSTSPVAGNQNVYPLPGVVQDAVFEEIGPQRRGSVTSSPRSGGKAEARRTQERGGAGGEAQEQAETVSMFQRTVHEGVDTLLARIDTDIAAVEKQLGRQPSTRITEQLETLRLTKTLLAEQRAIQQELDEETRFLYEGVFVDFISKQERDKRYQRRGTGGIELMLDAVRHAKVEIQRLQKEEPNKDKRSKLIPRPIEEHDLKIWENRVSQGLRAVLGPSSAVLDTGLVVGIVLSNVMARTGDVINATNPAYIVPMALGLKFLAPKLEKMKLTALTDDILRSSTYLSDREKGQKKKSIPWKQIRAIVGTGAYALTQFEAVLVAVAGAGQGGDAYREVLAARGDLERQTRNLDVPEGFETADYDDEQATIKAYEKLNSMGKFFVDLRRKFHSILKVEASGERAAGVGGSGRDGLGRNWGGKYALLNGTKSTEGVEGTLLDSAPIGLAEGMRERAELQKEFRERISDFAHSEASEGEQRERARQYREVADEIIQKHLDLHSSVLIEGVSVEQQIMAFHNDAIAAFDDPLFVDPTDSTKQISLRELRVLYETGALETGAEIATWSDEPTDTYAAKFAQSAGIAVPSRSTLRPHILKIQDVMPLYAYLQNTLFTERTELLMELLESRLKKFDDPNASANTAITLEVPELSLDVTPYTGGRNAEGRVVPGVNTTPASGWGSWETHHDAFKTWERALMSTSLLALIMLINFGAASLSRLRIRKTEAARREEFSEGRNQFEGDGDRQEGAEYLLAEHISENLNNFVRSGILRDMLPSISFTPDMVQAAMREAAAIDKVPVIATSPLSAPDSILGKTLKGMGGHLHDLKHMVAPTGLPTPPAVEAYNHLITLYKDSTALTLRIADQMLPGFAQMMETALKQGPAIKKALLSRDQFEGGLAFLKEEDRTPAAVARAKLITEIHDVRIGYHAFAKRYAETKIEHITNDALEELYNDLAEVSEDQRGQYLDLSKHPIDLLKDDLTLFDANNPGKLETMRDSGLRRTIAAELETQLRDAVGYISRANAEIARAEDEEILDTGLFGGEAAQIIKTAQGKRRAKLTKLSGTFLENNDPHIRQFSSTTAIRDQVFQDVKRSVLAKWYGSVEEKRRTSNWVGIPVVKQLEALKEIVGVEHAYLVSELPKVKIDALDEQGPFSGITVEVHIESRKKQRRSKRGVKVTQEIESMDGDVPEIQVDRHVINFTFVDRDGKPIFSMAREIRNTLSKVEQVDEIKRSMSQWIENRRNYFSARVLLDAIDERVEDAKAKNEREIRELTARLGKLGFSVPLALDEKTNNFAPIDLMKKGADEAANIYFTELNPRRTRRKELTTITNKRKAHERTTEKTLTPHFAANRGPKNVFKRAESILEMSSKLYASLLKELQEPVETDQGKTRGTLEGRVSQKAVSNVREFAKAVQGSERELRRAGITLTVSPGSPEWVTIQRSKGLLSWMSGTSKAAPEDVLITEILEYIKDERPDPRRFAQFLKTGKNARRRQTQDSEVA